MRFKPIMPLLILLTAFAFLCGCNTLPGGTAGPPDIASTSTPSDPQTVKLKAAAYVLSMWNAQFRDAMRKNDKSLTPEIRAGLTTKYDWLMSVSKEIDDYVDMAMANKTISAMAQASFDRIITGLESYIIAQRK